MTCYVVECVIIHIHVDTCMCSGLHFIFSMLTGCHLKCHKEHVDRADSVMQPCVGGERDVKRVLLLISNDEDRKRWLNRLSQITIAREDSNLKPPSPPYVCYYTHVIQSVYVLTNGMYCSNYIVCVFVCVLEEMISFSGLPPFVLKGGVV